MAFCSLKLVGPLPPVTGKKSSLTHRTEFTVQRNLQVRSGGVQEKPPSSQTTLTTRREVILCMTSASVSAISLFSTESVEARIVKPEIRRKIKEKLEMLREKAGLSKPKTKDENFAKDKKSPPPSPSPDNPQNNPTGLLVETTLPK